MIESPVLQKLEDEWTREGEHKRGNGKRSTGALSPASGKTKTRWEPTSTRSKMRRDWKSSSRWPCGAVVWRRFGRVW